MPKCPQCHKEIDHLVEYSPETLYYDVRLVKGELDWEQRKDEAECMGGAEYHCPECDGLIGKGNSDVALEFLKGVSHADVSGS